MDKSLKKLKNSIDLLYELSLKDYSSFEELYKDYLNTGIHIFGLEVGIISNISGDSYKILSTVNNLGIQAGTVLELGNTYCKEVFEKKISISYNHVGKMPGLCNHPAYLGLKLESYISAPIIVKNKIYGTINFSSTRIRESEFQKIEIETIAFMAKAIAQAIEKDLLAKNQEILINDLYRSQSLFKGLFDSNPDLFLLADEDRNIIQLNDSIEKNFGYTKIELLGKSTSILYEDFEKFSELKKNSEIQANQSPNSPYEVNYKRKDGSIFPGETLISKISDKNGKFQYYYAQIKDISFRKEVERVKNDFVANISHELRTPIAAIQASLELVLNGMTGEISPDTNEMIDVANRNSKRLLTIVNELLDIEQLEVNKINLELKKFDLINMVQDVYEEMKTLINKDKHIVKIKSISNNLNTDADYDRIKQVLINLLSNALKYSPIESKITIVLESNENWHQVSVIDNGPGISDDFSSKIFNKFNREEIGDSKAHGGIGLGLCISKSIVELHDGKLDYDKDHRNGAKFYFKLKKAN